MDSCIVMCPCCGTMLQVTSDIFGSNAYPFHSNMQMSLRDMIQSGQIAQQPNYAQMCCAINQEENKSV